MQETSIRGAVAGVLACALVAALAPAAAQADEFLGMPGLWKTTYEVEGAVPDRTAADKPRVVWHCVVEEADPWVSFAQLEDLPGMKCSRSALQRTSTSLKWKMRCQGPGPDAVADVIEAAGAIVFDSPQHYTGWVRFTGTLLGYPLESGSKVEGSRRAACTSPSD